jgi:hypothetical protein
MIWTSTGFARTNWRKVSARRRRASRGFAVGGIAERSSPSIRNPLKFGEHGDPALVEGIGTLLHPALDLR